MKKLCQNRLPEGQQKLFLRKEIEQDLEEKAKFKEKFA